MKLTKTNKVLIAIVVVIVLLVGCGSSQYNGMVKAEEGLTTAWSNVETQYQRRADLIPNLVNTVKGYAAHEEGTFKELVEARAKATQITVDPTQLTPEKMKEFQAAQGQLSAALGKLLAIQENYPELKANENFLELQAQLEGTENRINESRRIYNQRVEEYNLKVRSCPANVFGGIFGFTSKTKFEAEEAAKQAPKVEF